MTKLIQLPKKLFYTLEEVAKELNCSIGDLLQFAYLRKLQLCFLIPEVNSMFSGSSFFNWYNSEDFSPFDEDDDRDYEHEESIKWNNVFISSEYAPVQDVKYNGNEIIIFPECDLETEHTRIKESGIKYKFKHLDSIEMDDDHYLNLKDTHLVKAIEEYKNKFALYLNGVIKDSDKAQLPKERIEKFIKHELEKLDCTNYNSHVSGLLAIRWVNIEDLYFRYITDKSTTTVNIDVADIPRSKGINTPNMYNICCIKFAQKINIDLRSIFISSFELDLLKKGGADIFDMEQFNYHSDEFREYLAEELNKNKEHKPQGMKTLNRQADFIKALLISQYGEDMIANITKQEQANRLKTDLELKGLAEFLPSIKTLSNWIKQAKD